LCARTLTDQFGMESTVKLTVSVVSDVVRMNVPAPLPLIGPSARDHLNRTVEEARISSGRIGR
jgi:hypothetical protein